MNKKTPLAFYFIAILIPVAFFVLIEVGLQMADYGRDYRLFVKPERGTPGLLYVNPDRSYKYFGDLKGSVFFEGNGFLEEKPQNGFRVFVLGGSSAQGFPYAKPASFPSQLQRRMEKSHPNQYFEVVNLGASAINSYTLQDILPEVLEQSPDLILIYAGHNEYYGALGSGSSRTGVSNPAFTQFLLRLKEFRTYQLLENGLAVFASSNRQSANLMEEMIGQSFIDLGSETFEAGVEQYEYNMRDVLEQIHDANVPVIIGTLVSKLKDQKPFSSGQKDEKGWDASDYYRQAKERLMQDSVQAKSLFAKARELDGLRFRAPEAMNAAIRRLARAYMVPLVDADSFFSSHSDKGIPGEELLCDHLHPNMAGHFLMSKAYYREMQQSGFLSSEPEMNTGASELDSILIAEMPFSKLDSVQAQRTLVNLLGNYPYVPKGLPNPLLSTIEMRDYIDELGREKDTDSTRILVAGYYWENQQIAEFKREIRAMLQMMPSKEWVYDRALIYLESKGFSQEAYPVIKEEIHRIPNHASKWKMLAKYHRYQGASDSVYLTAERGLELRSNDPELYELHGYAALVLGKYEQAEVDYSHLLALNPENIEAHHQRGVARFELKDYKGTVADFNAIIERKEKADGLAFLIRGYAHYGSGDQSMACEDWQQAVRLGHSDARVLLKKHCQQ